MQRPEQSFFLLGPRGTGKTGNFGPLSRMPMSLICYPRRSTRGFWRIQPLRSRVRSVPDGRWVVVDEVQRLPNLLNEVHRFIEEKRCNLCSVDQAPAGWKLARASTLLAGRAAPIHAPLSRKRSEAGLIWKRPFSLSCCRSSETQPQRQRRFPLMPALSERGDQAEALVRNLPGFARFLPAPFHGQMVNVSNMAREAGWPGR